MPNYTPAYTDLDPIPFGKYKGTVLQDVPASYLAWMRDAIQVQCDALIKKMDVENGYLPVNDREKIHLYNYIRNSWDAIKMDLPDRV